MLLSLFLAAALSGQPAAASPSPSAACAYTGGADTIAVPGHPFAAEPSPDGCWLFVSLVSRGQPGGVTVLKNSAGRFTAVRTVTLRDGAWGLGLSRDGRLLFTASGDAINVLSIARLEGEDGDPVLGRLFEGAGVGAIYVAPSLDDRLLFISDERAMRVTVVDIDRLRSSVFSDKAVLGHVPQASAPVGLALSPDGGLLFATSERAPDRMTFPVRCESEAAGSREGRHPEGVLSVIDVAKARSDPAHALIALAPGGCNPVRVALTPDGATAWVTARGENAVYSFDVASLRAAPAKVSRVRYPAGDSPVGLAIQPGSNTVWVSDSNRFSPGQQGEIQSVALGPGKSASILKSGRFPRDLAFLPDGRTLVAAVFGSDAVQLVPTP